MLVALGVDLGSGGIGEGKALDAGFGQGEEFACVGHGVTIPVFPDAKLGEGGVRSVDPAVGVTVEVGEGGKAVGGSLSVGEKGMVAKEFAAIVDPAIAVAVEDEQAVVFARPAALFGKAVAVVVEMETSVQGECFDAVAVEIENEWGAGLGGGGEFLLEGGEEVIRASPNFAPIFSISLCSP